MKPFQESLVERLQNKPINPHSSGKIVLSKAAFVIISLLYVIIGTFLGHLGAYTTETYVKTEYVEIPVAKLSPDVLSYLDTAHLINPELEWEMYVVENPVVGGLEGYTADTVTGILFVATTSVRGVDLESTTYPLGHTFVGKFKDRYVHESYEIVDYFDGKPSSNGYLLKKGDFLVKVQNQVSSELAEEGEVKDFFGYTPDTFIHTILITADRSRANKIRESATGL